MTYKINAQRIIHATIVAVFVNTILAITKIIVGTIANSRSLVADGVHSFSDLITDISIIIGAKYWNSPTDKCHPYGHGRVETIIILFIGIVLTLTSIGIGKNAIITITEPHNLSLEGSVLTLALLSIISKEILYRWTALMGQRIRSKALVANAWHHRSDAISSIPVAAAYIFKLFFHNMQFLDNIAALFVAAMLLKIALKISCPCLCELVETRMEIELENRIINESKKFSNIKEIHKIRCRRMGKAIFVDLHMLVNPTTTVQNAHELATLFKYHLVKLENNVLDVLIHIEPFKS